MHTQTVMPGEVDPLDGEEAYGYTPPHDVAPIPMKTQKPSVKSLDKKKVAIIAGTFSIAILFAVVAAFSPTDHKPKPAEEVQQAPAQESAQLNALPSDYNKLGQQRAGAADGVPPLGPPMPGDLGGMKLAHQRDLAAGSAGDPALGQGQVTPAQQFAQQESMNRLQRAASARNAGSGFSGGGMTTPSTPSFAGGSDPLAALAAQAAAIHPGSMGGPGNAHARDDANRQDDKQGFVSAHDHDDAQLNERLLPAPSSFVGAGTIIPALFLTGVNSDLPGMLTAQVSEPVYDTVNGRHILIPQGAVLIGQYDSRVTYGQNRVLLVWQRIRFPDGTSLGLEGMPGVDMSGYAGVHDRVNNHWGKLAGAVVLSSVLAAGVSSSQGDTYSVTNPSLSQQATQAAGASINQAGQRLVDRALNVQPTLEIRPGQRVAVMVSTDLLLPTYAP